MKILEDSILQMMQHDDSAIAYPWYEVIRADDNTVEQGDFFDDVMEPVLPITRSSDQTDEIINFEPLHWDVIVISQSCDLAYGKLAHVLVAPYFPLADAKQQYSHLNKRDNLESLRRGNQVGLHVLNRCEHQGYVEDDFIVVNFRQVFTVPFEYVVTRAAHSASRLRLRPPYREHLAQAYARFIMRIGLPIDIPDLA